MKKILIVLSLVLVSSCGFMISKAFGETNTISSTVTSSAPSMASSPSIQIPQAVCRFGVSGAVSSSFLGISTGMAVTDETCQLVLLAKLVAGLNLKVGSVSILCQDPRVFQGLWDAALYCPKEGKIGEEARELWVANWRDIPEGSPVRDKLELAQPPKKRKVSKDGTVEKATTIKGGLLGLLTILLIL
jgi:hypothetical protein